MIRGFTLTPSIISKNILDIMLKINGEKIQISYENSLIKTYFVTIVIINL